MFRRAHRNFAAIGMSCILAATLTSCSKPNQQPTAVPPTNPPNISTYALPTTAPTTQYQVHAEKARQALIVMVNASSDEFLKAVQPELSEPLQPGGYDGFDVSIGGWHLNLQNLKWERNARMGTRLSSRSGVFEVHDGQWTAKMTGSSDFYPSVGGPPQARYE